MMRILLALALCVAAVVAVPLDKSPVLTLRDYYASVGSERIIGGSPAVVAQFPWQVAVYFVVGGNTFFCGGALISNEWVLTAAHCAQGASSFTMYLGGITLSSTETGRITVTSTNAIVHAGYNPNNLNNDVALIRISPVSFNNRIQPIRLPTAGTSVGAGVSVRVSGWGRTSDASQSISNILNWVDLTTISNAQCASVYGSSVVVSSTICAVGNPHHSTCNGDSGGPLITIDGSGQATHQGIVSFVSSAGCGSGNPSGYVRTTSMLPWIASQTGLTF